VKKILPGAQSVPGYEFFLTSYSGCTGPKAIHFRILADMSLTGAQTLTHGGLGNNLLPAKGIEVNADKKDRRQIRPRKKTVPKKKKETVRRICLFICEKNPFGLSSEGIFYLWWSRRGSNP
jgi:hypothetical protein